MTGGYKGLQEVTRGCSVLQEVRGGLQRITEDLFFLSRTSPHTFSCLFLKKIIVKEIPHF